MSENEKNRACRTFVDTLDTMAFIPAEPVDRDDAPPPDDAVLVSLGFTGARVGRLELVASRRFARLLAANVVGEDPADPDAEQKAEDSIKELINVTVGAMMPHLAKSERDEFSLALPTLDAFPPERWAAFASCGGVTVLDADGETLALRLVA